MKTAAQAASKMGRWMVVGLAVIVLTGPAAQAVTIQADAWILLPQGAVTVTEPAPGTVRAAFANGFSQPGSLTLQPSSADPGKLFSGDYAAAKINSLLVTLNSQTKPQLAGGTHVKLISGNDVWVSYQLSVTGAGQATPNRVSMERVAGGWILWPGDITDENELNARWAADLREVDAVKVFLPKNGDEGQQYVISDFALDGERAISALTPLEAALLERFGVTSASEVSAADAAVDSDGDGMTDLEEILAENDAAYFENKLFKAELTEDGTGVTISWKAVAGHKYTLLRYDSMADQTGDEIFSVTPAETGVRSYTDTEAAGEVQFFYRVVQD